MSDNDKIDFSIFLKEYSDDSREGFKEINKSLLALEKDFSRTDLLDGIFRAVHTLKSSSNMLGFDDTAGLAEACEDLLDDLRKGHLILAKEVIDLIFGIIDTMEEMVGERRKKKGARAADFGEKTDVIKAEIERLKKGGGQNPGKPAPKAKIPVIEKVETVKVHVKLLDSLFNLSGELIIARNRLKNLLAGAESKELKHILADISRMINEMQENVSEARLVPVDDIFQKFPRMMRDLAAEVGKDIELLVEGRDIELDKATIDALGEPLIHLLRNAADHGIETPAVRNKLNKSSPGAITLSAERAENQIFIDVKDDGGGIDLERMRELIAARGLASGEEAKKMDDREVMDFLFTPGFTTVAEATGLSGRGVGLDVVKTSARGMGGVVEVETRKGEGTRFRLRLPLSTAIIHTLMVGVGDHVFAIPTDIVLETMEVGPDDIRKIRKDESLLLRGGLIPFVRLNRLLGIERRKEQEGFVAVIINRGERYTGVGVDTVHDQIENIVKPFDTLARQVGGFSGGTILGDGRVALLLDLPGLLGAGAA